MFEAAVSTAAGGACAGSAAVLYYAENLPGLKKFTNKLHTDRAQALLIATAVASAVATPAGAWWNRTVNGLNTWSMSLIGSWTGLTVIGLAGLLVVIMFVNDLLTRKVEHRTRVLAALLPVLITSIPGPIGSGLQAVLGWVVHIIGSLVAGLFGLG